jgi:hypothetical protein
MTMIAGVLMVRPAANRDGSARLATKPIATIVGDAGTDAAAFSMYPGRMTLFNIMQIASIGWLVMIWALAMMRPEFVHPGQWVIAGFIGPLVALTIGKLLS